MSKSISLLIGAGFSVPKGYPTGKELNHKILNCGNDNLSFSSAGQLYVRPKGIDADRFGFKTTDEIEFEFLINLIKFFNKDKGYFDYEEFYDFVKDEAVTNKGAKEASKSFINDLYSYEQLLFSLDKIYPQLISYYLKDRDGEVDYDNAGHMCGPIFPGYTGILDAIKTFSQDYIVDVHTLNHDLFFERLNISDWIGGQLCDGFDELGSPYYGELDANRRTYHVRLSMYTGKYDKKFRLYKLHGSRDYIKYYSSQGIVAKEEIYVKLRYGVNPSELLKEKLDDMGRLSYERCWFNYHADFLTGTTSKIIRYKEPLFYQELFMLFKKNLTNASLLLIVGYGGKDAEINKILLENYDYKNKLSYVIDPFPEAPIIALAESLNAKVIKKHLDDVDLKDF